MYIGIDVQNILWEPQQTAFQTEVQREASQKRINTRLLNRDFAYERLADLFKDLLQTYFPIKTLEWAYPEIEIEWAELKGKKFRKKKGKSIFKVTPETIRGNVMIDVYTNATAPTINVVDREQKMQLVKSIADISQWYAVAKQSWFDIEKILPVDKTIKDLAKDFNLSTIESSGSENKEKIQSLRDELKWFIVPTPWAEPAEEEVLPPNEWLWA